MDEEWDTDDFELLKAFAVDNLSPKQEEAVHEIIKGTNVLLTGPGGTGKSLIISRVTKFFDKLKKKFLLMAPTGLSALNIGGRTIHSTIKTGLCSLYLSDGTTTGQQFSVAEFTEYLTSEMTRLKSRKRKPQDSLKKGSLSMTLVKTIKALEIIIVDEISMISIELFEKMNAFFQVLRETSRPFGGLKVVLVGDFFQLPPVTTHVSQFIFESPLFQKVVQKRIDLDILQRQIGDTFFGELLNRARKGLLTDEDHCALQNRVGTNVSHDGIEPTILYSRNADVEKRNQLELDKLTGPSHKYEFLTRIWMRHIQTDIHGKPIENEKDYQTQLDKLVTDVDPKTLELKVGAQVRLTVNWNLDEGLCNGSRGVVIGFMDRKEYKDKVSKGLIKDTSDFQQPLMIPIVRFETKSGLQDLYVPNRDLKRNGERQDPDTKTYERTSDVILTVTLLPLKLAWASTIHSMQGMTLSRVQIQLDQSVFEKGQAYVALSRCKTLNGITLTKQDSDVIRCNDKVLFFETHSLDFLKDHQTKKSEQQMDSVVPHLISMESTLRLYHWNTISFARHKASCALIEDTVKQMDAIVEALLGLFDRGVLLRNSTINLKVLSDAQMPTQLSGVRAQLRSWDSFVTASEILNLRDELLASIDKALYLMTLQ